MLQPGNLGPPKSEINMERQRHEAALRTTSPERRNGERQLAQW
jgi:hypothetical protein